MHEPVVSRLEDVLHSAEPIAEVENHLQHCPACRRELAWMRMQAEMIQSLRPPVDLEAPPAFYAKVMNRIDSQAKPSVWNIFGESLFAKRLAYASMTLLVLLGTFLISDPQGEDTLASNTPEIALSGREEAPVEIDDDTEQAREAVLVNLATYQDF